MLIGGRPQRSRAAAVGARRRRRGSCPSSACPKPKRQRRQSRYVVERRRSPSWGRPCSSAATCRGAERRQRPGKSQLLQIHPPGHERGQGGDSAELRKVKVQGVGQMLCLTDRQPAQHRAEVGVVRVEQDGTSEEICPRSGMSQSPGPLERGTVRVEVRRVTREVGAGGALRRPPASERGGSSGRAAKAAGQRPRRSDPAGPARGQQLRLSPMNQQRRHSGYVAKRSVAAARERQRRRNSEGGGAAAPAQLPWRSDPAGPARGQRPQLSPAKRQQRQ
jgi:hypothetical protein